MCCHFVFHVSTHIILHRAQMSHVPKKNDGQIESPLEALLVQYGDGFRKANMEEWEQKANASEYSDQESAFRWKDPSSWSWDTQDSSDKEIFARMTHASSDESESSCGPYWSPKPVNSGGISFDTLKHMDDGWNNLVNLHLFLQVYIPRRNHLGNRIQTQVLQGARGHADGMMS